MTSRCPRIRASAQPARAGAQERGEGACEHDDQGVDCQADGDRQRRCCWRRSRSGSSPLRGPLPGGRRVHPARRNTPIVHWPHGGHRRVVQSASRARSVGVYRQPDAGFAVGAVLGGVEADAYAIRAAVRTVPALITPPHQAWSWLCTCMRRTCERRRDDGQRRNSPQRRPIPALRRAAGSQEQRCEDATPANTESTCWPHPAQVALPHCLHVAALHMVVLSRQLSNTPRVYGSRVTRRAPRGDPRADLLPPGVRVRPAPAQHVALNASRERGGPACYPCPPGSRPVTPAPPSPSPLTSGPAARLRSVSSAALAQARSSGPLRPAARRGVAEQVQPG